LTEELDGLVLRYDYRDTDATGVLAAEVRFGGFAGASSAWFSDEELLGFADRLTTYPLGDSEFSVSGGYGRDEDFEECVGLTARAVGLRGQVGAIAHLAAPDRAPHVPRVVAARGRCRGADHLRGPGTVFR
jgi:hypothetical protein